MKVIIADCAGFCYGVDRSIRLLDEEIGKGKHVFCYGEIVHNKYVVDSFYAKGVELVHSLDNVYDTVVIRAHGITKEEYELLNNKNVKIVDLTCPNVLRIHDIICEYVKQKYYIVLIGHSTHPETIGSFSFCGDNASVVENIDEVDMVCKKIDASGIKNVLIVSQTTFNVDLFNELADAFNSALSSGCNLVIKNTVCNATMKRQEAAKKLAKKVDVMVVIGDKKSSNSNKLYEVSNELCNRCFFIESCDELDLSLFNENDVVGVTAGASTPKEIIDGVVKVLTKK